MISDQTALHSVQLPLLIITIYTKLSSKKHLYRRKSNNSVNLESLIRLQNNPALGAVCRKPRKLFGPVKPLLVHLYVRTEKCIRLKLLA